MTTLDGIEKFFEPFWFDEHDLYIYHTLPGNLFCWVEVWGSDITHKYDWCVGNVHGQADSCEEAKIAAFNEWKRQSK